MKTEIHNKIERKIFKSARGKIQRNELKREVDNSNSSSFQKRETEKRSSRYLFPWTPRENFQQDGQRNRRRIFFE